MLRLTSTAENLRAAPLARQERADVVQRILTGHSIFAARMGHAASVGITITYVHLSDPADARAAVLLLAEGLDWEDTDIADVAGTVAVTTHRG